MILPSMILPLFASVFCKLQPPFRRVLILACLIFLNGCATSYLWRGSDIAGYNEPMPTNHLALFNAPEKHDMLVQYDECPAPSGKLQRRAYFVFENARRTESAKRPSFVNLTNANGLAQIPVWRTPDATNNAVIYGVQGENPNRF